MPASSPCDRKVDQLLGALPPELKSVGLQLRALVRTAAPELRECVKWGNPMWVGRTNSICLMLFRDHINLGFFQGARLSQKFAELEGTGKGLRHVKIRTRADATRPMLKKIIRAAVRLDRPLA